MKQKQVAIVVAFAIIGCVAVLLVKYASVFAAFVPQRGDLTETWQSTQTPFPIRIDKYPEIGGFVPGAHFVFFSFDRDTQSWSEIMTFRHDDPVGIPADRVRYTNERIATVSMGWQYAVTVDGGKSWMTSDLLRLQPECLYNCIEELSVNGDGTGSARLKLATGQVRNKVLRTNDFGKSWIE